MMHFLNRFSGRVPSLIALARSHIGNNTSSNFTPSLQVISLRHISAARTLRYSGASGTVLASTNEADILAQQATGPPTEELGMDALTPAKVVEMLDRYIVGQTEAKRAVAVALRMRSSALLLPLV